MKRMGLLVGGVAVVALVALVAGVVFWPEQTTTSAPAGEVRAETAPELSYERVSSPARTIVRNRDGAVVATFTDDARTALINGARRTFSEPKATAATVNMSAWVRLLPQPWVADAEKAAWFEEWFRSARADTSPDVLAVATQYTIDAPAEKDAKGVRFRGDASFGPVKASGAGRQEQSDFYDYLGVPWQFQNGPAGEPDRNRYGSVDCSGYVRLVFGYRFGMPMHNTNTVGPGLPRRAFAISEFGPGVQLVRNEMRRATDYSALQPGDLVFFEVEDDQQTLDHVGIHLGIDDRGKHRFISSRERINGPTMGDVGGTSLLDDGGTYSNAWRSARRL